MAERKNRLFWALCVLCLLSLGIMASALIGAAHPTGDAGFEPPPFEAAAEAGTPQVPEALSYAPIEAKDAFTACICGQPALEDGKAVVYFTSPADNAVWLKLRVLDDTGTLIGETGLLKPGEYVKAVPLTKIPADGAAMKLKIMAYEPDTYLSMGAVSLNTTVLVG